jgi:hypothetical protein
LSADSAIRPPVSSTPEVGAAGLEGERRARLRDAVLAGPAAAAASPLDQAQRAGLLARLVAAGDVQRALAGAGHADVRIRALPGPVTTGVVLALALHSGEGYDSVLAKVVPHLRGGTLIPGPVPSASALSQARVRLGAEPLRLFFEQQAADAPPARGPGASVFDLEVTGFEGTCLELPREPELIEAFGCPTGAKRPQARLVTLVTCGNRRIQAAAIGSYHTSEQELVDRLAGALRPGTVNLADRNFFSMHRFARFAATGAHLVWRVKNGATSLPARIVESLPDGSHLVRLRESDSMRARRRMHSGDPGAARLPDTTARMIEFAVRVTDERGRTRTSRIRLLTTLLDPEAYPAKALASLYAERWQVEITFLRLKTTLRGAGTVLRGHGRELIHQEIWAFLAVYNLLCDLAAQAAALHGIDPDEISFVTVLRLTRTHLGADLPCTHCAHRPDQPLQDLASAIAAAPRNRTGRSRTSPRTRAERNNGHTQKAVYTITITESNLLKTDY